MLLSQLIPNCILNFYLLSRTSQQRNVSLQQMEITTDKHSWLKCIDNWSSEALSQLVQLQPNSFTSGSGSTAQDQGICCDVSPPGNDKDTTHMSARQYGCLNKAEEVQDQRHANRREKSQGAPPIVLTEREIVLPGEEQSNWLLIPSYQSWNHRHKSNTERKEQLAFACLGAHTPQERPWFWETARWVIWEGL